MGRDERVLDAALRVRGELPYACKGGVCSTCRAKVVDGEVTMARNYALEPDEVAAGYVLTCQSSPTTDELDRRLRRMRTPDDREFVERFAEVTGDGGRPATWRGGSSSSSSARRVITTTSTSTGSTSASGTPSSGC